MCWQAVIVSLRSVDRVEDGAIAREKELRNGLWDEFRVAKVATLMHTDKRCNHVIMVVEIRAFGEKPDLGTRAEIS